LSGIVKVSPSFAIQEVFSTGEKTLSFHLDKAQAQWLRRDLIAWDIPLSGSLEYSLHYNPDGKIFTNHDIYDQSRWKHLVLKPLTDESGKTIFDQFPHLKGYTLLTLNPKDWEAIPEILKGQIALSAVDSQGTILAITGLQIPGVLDDLYSYPGSLGVIYQGSIPTLSVWAPTAKSVTLNLFNSSEDPESEKFLMKWDPKTGVWSINGSKDWNNKFYLYDVEVYVPSLSKVVHNLVTDPYSVSLAQNSQRSQIVNLEDPNLQPPRWSDHRIPNPVVPEDSVIYELHVRDFSIQDFSVPEAWRGTFKAFTVDSSIGHHYLQQLAQAGVTHVHLLPIFDFVHVNEDKTQWQLPDPALLSQFPPDSDQQQALIVKTQDQDGFNWGYDPYHYGVPEGSYATDADGSKRILECREMIQALHQMGFQVVMDVVYNHTFAAGQADESVLDRIVPGYYHRLNEEGDVESSTCCANTATEHYMMEKLLIDTIKRWIKDYKIDGFRFDLMGHHLKSNLIHLQKSLQDLAVSQQTVNGSRIYLYGEAWDFGEMVHNRRGVNASQVNLSGTGIGTFNDRFRDGLRGGNFLSSPTKQGFLTGLWYHSNQFEVQSQAEQLALLRDYTRWIEAGLAGNLQDYPLLNEKGFWVKAKELNYNGNPVGYTQDPEENILYISSHDNETLFDVIQIKSEIKTSLSDRIQMHEMGLSFVLLGQGVPFIHAGDEILRSKSLDKNSYNSGDWFNRLDLTLQHNGWPAGLPPAMENQDRWSIIQPLLADPTLHPTPEDILHTQNRFLNLLAIRRSSKLFRLETANDILQKVKFLTQNTVPGLIIMQIKDQGLIDLDPEREEILVFFNATKYSQWIQDPAFLEIPYHLHPLQKDSKDFQFNETKFDPETGCFLIPSYSTLIYEHNLDPLLLPNASDLLLEDLKEVN
jgi:pullulanase-type alpha-1,6-glucosidase